MKFGVDFNSASAEASDSGSTDLERCIAQLSAVGIRLWEDQGQLRFRAPKGALNEERRNWLRANKAAIVDLLGKKDAQAAMEIDPLARYEPFPLTDVQGAYLMGRQSAFAYGGIACHGYMEIATYKLDADRVTDVWNQLIQRHDMLRAVIHPDGYQRIIESPTPIVVRVVDLTSSSATEIEQFLVATRAEMSHRVYPTDQFPLHELRITQLQDQSIIHLSIDLLISDLASMQLLMLEFDQLYQERSLPPLELGFRDYVIADRARKQPGGTSTARYERDRTYWLAQLATLPAAPDLPIANGRQGTTGRDDIKRPRFHRLYMQLDAADWSALTKRATRRGLTPSNAVLSAYAEVIGRFSRRPDFTLNLTVRGRTPLHPQVDALVGDFTTISLLDVHRASEQDHRQEQEPSFGDWAQTLQEKLMINLEHGSFSGLEVMRELSRQRSSNAALMPVVYTSGLGLADSIPMHTPISAGPFGKGQLQYGVSQTPQVWIDCQVLSHEGKLVVNWDVREGVIEDGVVESMFCAFEDLIKRLAASEAPWNSPAPMHLSKEQEERRIAYNATSIDQPDRLLFEPILESARRTPTAPALISNQSVVSYEALVIRAQALAATLLQQGVQSGDLVGVIMHRGVEQAIAVLGIMLAGAAYLPIDTAQPPRRRAEILTGAKVRVVVTQRALLEAGVVATEQQENEWPENVTLCPLDIQTELPSVAKPLQHTSSLDPDALAYVIYTSGSTGHPKGVMISHAAAYNTVMDINARFALHSEDRVLGVAQLGFDLSVWDIFGPLSVGGALVIPDEDRRSDPAHWAQLIQQQGVTLWNSVPAQLQMLNEYLDSETGATVSNLRLAMLSGDWIPVTLPGQFQAHAPDCVMVSLGGATEASIWSIYHVIADHLIKAPLIQAPPIHSHGNKAPSIPYGQPLTNQRFHVLDQTLRPCPEYVPGELYIGGKGLSLGYFGDPELTEQRFITHPDSGERLYRTGDWGRFHANGTIEFLGREDTQIKIRGHRVELADIETALQSHPGVANAAVVVTGKRVAAFCQPAPDGSDDRLTARALHERKIAQQAAAAGNQAGQAFVANVDVPQVLAFAQAADEVCLFAMALTLRQCGLFEPDTQHQHQHQHQADYSLADMIAACNVAQQHHRLFRRWLTALCNAGWLQKSAQKNTYSQLRLVEPHELSTAREQLDTLQSQVGFGKELLAYLGDNLTQLQGLLRGDTDPLELLFPQAELGTALAAYENNLASRYLNSIAVSVINTLAQSRAPGRPLRILELGAGVGGTSRTLIKSLAESVPEAGVDYHFTDISRFFLNEAQAQFSDYPWVRFGTFDINKDHRQQGMRAGCCDVIVCANVLHNAKHVHEVLARLSDVLAPGGYLVFIEATRENHPLLVSMEFQAALGGFEDFRVETGQTFLNRQQWLDALDEVDADVSLCVPKPGDPLEFAGQHIFVARMRSDKSPLDEYDLRTHVAEYLPPYMAPASFEIVNRLPMSLNSKIDRKRLQSWADACEQAATHAGDGGPAPQDDLEQSIADLFATLLGLDSVGRDGDFYLLGGDSLLIAQLVARMRERLPETANVDWDTLLRVVVREPTVAGIADHLRIHLGNGGDDGNSAAARISPITILRQGQQDYEATVLVHDGSGTLSPYHQLLARMSTGIRKGNGAIYGLSVMDAAPYFEVEPAHLIEQLAADYTEHLLAQNHPSYRVIGYCMGGLLGTEVARQLMEAGATVSGLTAISCYRVPYEIQDELVLEYAFARAIGAGPNDLGYPDDDEIMGRALNQTLAATPGLLSEGYFTQLDGEFSMVRDKFTELAKRDPRARLAAIGKALCKDGLLELPVEQLETAFRFFRHTLAAITLYEPAPYVGDITFVRDSGMVDFMPGLRDAMQFYWSDLCLGELTLLEVPGNHFTCMEAPNVESLAQIINTNIKRGNHNELK